MKDFLKILVVMSIICPTFLLAQTPTVPDAPLNLLGRSAAKEIYVQWDVPLSDGGSAIDGYNLNYREGNSGVWMSSFTTLTNYTLSSLTQNTEYQIFVTAVNIVGESRPSETINIQLGPFDEEDTVSPVVVGEIVVSNISNDGATITWTTDEPTTSAIYYDVHREDQHGLVIGATLTTEHQIDLSGLISCSEYFFVVGGEDASENFYTSSVEEFETSGCVGQVTSQDVGDLVPPDSVNTFSFENAKVEIVAGPGIVDRDAVFQVKRLSVSSVDGEVGCPVDAKPLGENIYDIKLLDNYDSVASIREPVTVTIDYGDEDIDNIKEESLSLYHYAEGVGWQKLNSCSVNKEEKKITCEVQNFSKFMVAVEENCDSEQNNWFFSKFDSFFSKIDHKIKTFFWGKIMGMKVF